MSNVYICTQGTSISNGGEKLANLARLQRELQGRHETWDFTCAEFEKELQAKLSTMEADALPAVSAELSILAKHGARKGDRVVLLCSDGYLGRICGVANKAMITKVLGVENESIEVVRVLDLQVKDGDRLSQFGLKNFVECARKAIEQYNGFYTTYLCPNGGYKGVVPFLTLLGMQYHCNVLYTFEFANSVVTLPPLPYVFDRDLYLRARRALASLSENVEMREEVYLANIDGYDPGERDLFLGFVQYTRPGFVTPSPLVDAFIVESMARDAMLSRQAIQDLASEKGGNAYNKFCRLILNSQDVIWRQKNLHTFYKSDLIGIKPCHSTLRLLGLMVGNRYYVARVLQHDAYEQALKSLTKKDFPLDSFSLWHPPVEMQDVGSNLSTESELMEKNEVLKAQMSMLAIEITETKAALSLASEKSARFEEELSVARKTVVAECEMKKKLASDLDLAMARCCNAERMVDAERVISDELRNRLKQLEYQLSKPWYRRIFAKG